MRLYCSNLEWSIDDGDLWQLFAEYGEVTNASIATDRETGHSRGFAFIDMPNRREAQRAIESLNDSTVWGRRITVREAHVKPRRATELANQSR